MGIYDDIYRELGVTAPFIELANGRFQTELRDSIRAPFTSAGYSPAFVPIYSVDLPWYVGLWVNPVDRARYRHSIVRMVPEDGYRAVEEFRSFDQLGTYLVVQQLTTYEGMPECEAKAEALARGLAVDYDAALELANTVGDDVSSFGDHPAFRDDPPWETSAERYRGDWPHEGREVGDDELHKVSGLELTEEQHLRIQQRDACPLWLQRAKQPEVFARLLDAGDLASAWRCLNSPGWLFAEVRDALARLRGASDDPLLAQVVTAWSAQPHESFGGYGRSDRTTWWGRPTEPGDPKPDAITELARLAKERAERRR